PRRTPTRRWGAPRSRGPALEVRRRERRRAGSEPAQELSAGPVDRQRALDDARRGETELAERVGRAPGEPTGVLVEQRHRGAVARAARAGPEELSPDERRGVAAALE